MANAFYVLDEMCKRDPDGKHIVAFMSPDNFIEAKSGKNGWGFVKMAVNNETINKLFFSNSTIKIALIIYDLDTYTEINNEIEKGQEDGKD